MEYTFPIAKKIQPVSIFSNSTRNIKVFGNYYDRASYCSFDISISKTVPYLMRLDDAYNREQAKGGGVLSTMERAAIREEIQNSVAYSTDGLKTDWEIDTSLTEEELMYKHFKLQAAFVGDPLFRGRFKVYSKNTYNYMKSSFKVVSHVNNYPGRKTLDIFLHKYSRATLGRGRYLVVLPPHKHKNVFLKSGKRVNKADPRFLLVLGHWEGKHYVKGFLLESNYFDKILGII